MSILQDLVNLKPLSEKIEQNSVEMGLAYKWMNQAIKKGYPKQGAINYVTTLIKSQGFGAEYSKQCAEQAWADLNEKTVAEESVEVSEGVNEPDVVADELQDRLEQLEELMQEVKDLVRACPMDIRRHAESYWLPHIITALGSVDHDYMGGTSKYDTMKATIEKLREYEDDI